MDYIGHGRFRPGEIWVVGAGFEPEPRPSGPVTNSMGFAVDRSVFPPRRPTEIQRALALSHPREKGLLTPWRLWFLSTSGPNRRLLGGCVFFRGRRPSEECDAYSSFNPSLRPFRSPAAPSHSPVFDAGSNPILFGGLASRPSGNAAARTWAARRPRFGGAVLLRSYYQYVGRSQERKQIYG